MPSAKSYLFWWVLLAALFCSLPLFALSVEQRLPDQAQEARAQALFGELRCVVCAGQSLADSDTTLAVQMRAQVRRKIAQGASDEEVLDDFTAHYGASVRMAPETRGPWLLIWIAPFAFLATGAGLIVWRMRRQ